MQRKTNERHVFNSTTFLNVIVSFVFVFLFFLFLFVPKVHLKGDYIVNVNVDSIYHDKGVKSLKKINQKKAIIAIARTINEFIYYIFSINIK